LSYRAPAGRVALLAPESSVDEIVETTEEFMDRLDQLLLALHRR
jgi:hypothetical protein